MTSSKITSYEDIARAGTAPVPTGPYYRDDYFELEREAVFRRAWLVVGRSMELPVAGSFIVREIEAANVSLLIARARNGSIHAFHNVCPHRGSRLVQSSHGTQPAFSCQYHGWTFNLDGSLRGVPDREGFHAFDPRSCGLLPVRLEEFGGFLFVTLSASAEPLDQFLGGMSELLRTKDLEPFSECAEFDSIIEANWKTAQDNFQETYHVASIHQKTLVPVMTGPANPRGHPWYQLFGPHRRMRLWRNTDYRAPRFAGLAYRQGVTRYLSGGSAVDRGSDGLEVHALYPNIHINIDVGYFFTHQFWPLDAGRTRHIARLYFRPARTAGERILQEYLISSSRDVWAEDWPMILSAHQGTRSGALKEFRLHAHELPCRHAFEAVDQAVRRYASSLEVRE